MKELERISCYRFS